MTNDAKIFSRQPCEDHTSISRFTDYFMIYTPKLPLISPVPFSCSCIIHDRLRRTKFPSSFCVIISKSMLGEKHTATQLTSNCVLPPLFCPSIFVESIPSAKHHLISMEWCLVFRVGVVTYRDLIRRMGESKRRTDLQRPQETKLLDSLH